MHFNFQRISLSFSSLKFLNQTEPKDIFLREDGDKEKYKDRK